MRAFARTAAGAAIALWLSTGSAQAASLGRLQMLSQAGQPLLAEIEVEGLTPEDLGSLKVGIPDTAAFKAVQLEPSPLLSKLRFDIVRGLTEDRATVRITSPDALTVPNLDALIELTWASGKVQREYTLTPARPPAETAALEVPQTPVVTPVSETPAAAPAKDAAASAKPSASPSAAGDAARRVAEAGSRTVRRGESLAQIAKEVAPNPAAYNATMAALFEKNRAAFIGNSIHQLREGAVLNIPAEDELSKRSNKAALQMLAEFDDRGDPYFQRMAAVPAPVKRSKVEDAASSGEIGRVQAERPAPKADDQLKVSRSRKDDKTAEAASAAQAEELLIKEKALREANDRIAALEKNLADMQRLLELKAAAGKADSAPGAAAAPAADKGEKGDKSDKGDKAAPAPTDASLAATDAAKAAEGDKPPIAPETELKPETTAEAEKPKEEAELADEHDDEADAKKAKPWYKNGLVLGGAGGAVVLGGGVAGFLYFRRRKQAEAAEPAPAVADVLADPTADLLNADVVSEEAMAAADADLPGLSDTAPDADAQAGEGELAALGTDDAAEFAAAGASDEPGGAGLLGGAADDAPAGEEAELAAAAVDLDFASAAADSSAGSEPLLPPEMSAGDPPTPAGGSNFADELDDLSARAEQASASLASLQAEGEGAAGDDDFGALGGDATAATLDDEPARQPGQRLSDTLAAIDLDLPGASDPLPADPLAEPALGALSDSGSDDFAQAAAFDEPAAAPEKADLGRWQEMETKLDLAAAYIEIGDAESARELLGEVMKQGDDAQLTRANELLARAV